MSSRAPGLSRLLANLDGPPTSLWVPPALRSVRGIEALESLESLAVPASIRLGPVARLPRLKSLIVEGPLRSGRRVRLAPLAAAPALESLMLHDLAARIDDVAALAAIPAFRALELHCTACPDLRPLVGSGLQRLVLDGARDVRARALAGLGVEQLDLWGCGLADIEVLSTMPRLRELWLPGNRVPSLRPLLHLGAGARVFLDDDVDPALHRREIADLEARGVWLMIARDPGDHGLHPSWWGGGAPALDPTERCVVRHRTADAAP